MAKKSKSRFTDLVKFVPDTEVPVYEDYDDNNEIRTNLLDAQYDDEYDEYDEYDAYSEDVEIIEEVKDIPEVEVIDTLEDVEETIDVEEDDMGKEIFEKDEDDFDELDLIEDIKPIRATYKKPESLSVNPPKEEKVSTNADVKSQNNMAPKKSTRQTEVTFDLDDLQDAMFNNNSKTNKEDYTMKRDIPDFIKEDDIDMEIHVPQQTHKYNAPQQQTYSSPVVDPSNMKESIILGNTTIKGDIITDSGIQIFGAVIGNIQSGGRVQLVGKVEGDISGNSVVITNTSLNGNIHAEQDVTVKTGCVVTGDVSGNKIILNGTIRGNIDAEGQVDFEAGSIIDGNVSAKSFNIKPGARINGSISTK